MTLTIGSLFSGTGALDAGVQSVLDARVIWHSDIKPAAVKLLAHRFPEVPNLGDITAVDWSQVERPDILTGGFPCTDISAAGKQLGLIRYGDGKTRSGLWAEMCRAIDTLRPSLVVAENVRAITSVRADSHLELCPWCVGDRPSGDALRALGAVLGDLADCGYDAAWVGLRAADVGAPHGRFRIFIIAWPDVAEYAGHDAGRAELRQQYAESSSRVGQPGAEPAADTTDERHERGGRARTGRGRSADSSLSVADADAAGSQGPQPASRRDVPDGGVAADAISGGRNGWALDTQRGPLNGTPPAGGSAGTGRGTAAAGAAVANAADDARDWCADTGAAGRGTRVAWGPYAPAIRRWELVLGRPAPAPTETGPKGGQRLSPWLPEWMMGLPEGWICAVPGLTRADKLSLAGDGVVPQQAAEALRRLLPVMASERGAA